MKVVLNVAEKPSVAREIVKFLSSGNARRVDGLSQFNPIHEFEYKIHGEAVLMRVTSVQGHIMGLEFREPYNKWSAVSPEDLFDAPVAKTVTADKTDIANNLKQAAKEVSVLALWLDCDREGENIAYEVIAVVSQVISLPTSAIRRAHFSALTQTDITNAIQNLGYPQFELSEAVEARIEIDLRLGAIFTRFQTMRLKNEISANKNLISWGPCQFPTLGFVVQRHLEIQNFRSEKYWTLDLKVRRPDGKTAIFSWSRKKLFDFLVVLVLYEKCLQSPSGKVLSVTREAKSKWRPVPLATIAFQKLVSSKLRIDSDKSMKIAEKLYQEGFISYPRTETDSFKSTINLRQLVELHTGHTDWGAYVEEMANGGFQWPRQGTHDDNSHPPIHPVKCATRNQLKGDEWKVYELITRHFLASCSQDAKGFQTTVKSRISEETFECKGLQVAELNFLKVYPYIKWNEADLPVFNENEEFFPSSLLMEEHDTLPPTYLTESDLITIMDKSGIGTDATIHQHIKTIQDRNYAEKTQSGLFKPTPLGVALVVGYSTIGTTLHNPELRAKMEKGMIDIVNKVKTRKDVVFHTLREMEEVFHVVKSKFQTIAKIIRDTVVSINNEQSCFKCGNYGHTANQCPQVLESNNKRNEEIKCFKCGRNGHFANNCPDTGQSSAVLPKKENACFKCGDSGHYANTCPGKKPDAKPVHRRKNK